MKKSIVLMTVLVACGVEAAAPTSDAESLWTQAQAKMKAAKESAATAWREMEAKMKNLPTEAKKAYQDLEKIAGVRLLNKANSYTLVVKARGQNERLGISGTEDSKGYILLPVGYKFTVVVLDKKTGEQLAVSPEYMRSKGYDIYELNYSKVTGFSVQPISVDAAKKSSTYRYLNLL